MDEISGGKSARVCHSGSPLSQASKLLRRLGLHPQKRWGQHFLIDPSVLQDIVTAADISPKDLVVEVGPGLGILTEEMTKRAGQVISIEVDSALAGALSHYFATTPNLSLINADVLEVDPSTLFRSNVASSGTGPEYKVVANIPYYITGPILRHFLEASLKPQLMVIMVQREVAERIVAARGDMAILSVAIQFYGSPTIVSYVPAQSFYPPPKVDSAILKIEVFPEPAVDVADPQAFFQVVRSGFSAPRKQLRNSLAQGLHISQNEAFALLEKVGIDPRQRAETLSLEQWAALYRTVHAT